MTDGLVSVIIPCYNSALFLSEAIESVLCQTYPHYEVLLVDDGSTDHSSQIAARYSDVRCLRQGNQGLSAARNSGLQHSKGEYVVFLDADDRLLPHALATGITTLGAHPECVLVCGQCRFIAADGSVFPTTPQRVVEKNHYREMLVEHYISNPASVMYRRSVFAAVGGFNTSLRAWEDCDLYMRIARGFPIYCLSDVLVEYRRHPGAMSCNSILMLKEGLTCYRLQRPYIKRDRDYRSAYQAGLARLRKDYGGQVIADFFRHLSIGNWWEASCHLLTLLRYHPQGFLSCLARISRSFLRRLATVTLKNETTERNQSAPGRLKP